MYLNIILYRVTPTWFFLMYTLYMHSGKTSNQTFKTNWPYALARNYNHRAPAPAASRWVAPNPKTSAMPLTFPGRRDPHTYRGADWFAAADVQAVRAAHNGTRMIATRAGNDVCSRRPACRCPSARGRNWRTNGASRSVRSWTDRDGAVRESPWRSRAWWVLRGRSWRQRYWAPLPIGFGDINIECVLCVWCSPSPGCNRRSLGCRRYQTLESLSLSKRTLRYTPSRRFSCSVARAIAHESSRRPHPSPRISAPTRGRHFYSHRCQFWFSPWMVYRRVVSRSSGPLSRECSGVE